MSSEPVDKEVRTYRYLGTEMGQTLAPQATAEHAVHDSGDRMHSPEENANSASASRDFSQGSKEAGHAESTTSKSERDGNEKTAGRMRISFMAYRQVREGLVWVDEIYTDKGHRGRGVARWMVWQVAKRQRVELQVKHGDEGKDARKAYVGMGMHALRGKERCRTYASVSSPEYEFWVTDEYVVTSGWDRRTAVGVTTGRWEEIRDAYGEDIVELLVETHGYTVGEAGVM